MHVDLLCPLFLSTNSSASKLFKSLNNYISGRLNWSFCIDVCTDGAAAMIGWLSGLTTWIRKVAFECESTHCIINKEMLVIRKLSTELNIVLKDITKVIDHMPLIRISSISSMKRWIQNINTFSFTEKLDNFLGANH